MEPAARRHRAAAALLSLLALAAASIAAAQSSPEYSLDALTGDFDRFERVTMKVNPRANADGVALSEALATGRSALRDGMGALSFHRVLAPTAAKIGCGHSGLRLPPEAEAQVRETAAAARSLVLVRPRGRGDPDYPRLHVL